MTQGSLTIIVAGLIVIGVGWAAAVWSTRQVELHRVLGAGQDANARRESRSAADRFVSINVVGDFAMEAREFAPPGNAPRRHVPPRRPPVDVNDVLDTPSLKVAIDPLTRRVLTLDQLPRVSDDQNGPEMTSTDGNR